MPLRIVGGGGDERWIAADGVVDLDLAAKGVVLVCDRLAWRPLAVVVCGQGRIKQFLGEVAGLRIINELSDGPAPVPLFCSDSFRHLSLLA